MEEMKLRIKSMICNTRKEEAFNQNSRKKKRIKKNKDRFRNLWNIFRCTNIQIIRVPKGEEDEIEKLFEKIMKGNFPNLVKEIDIQAQEAQRSPNKMDPKRTTPTHIIIKMPKVKYRERILKSVREKKLVTYMGVSIRLSADFLKETFQARRNW